MIATLTLIFNLVTLIAVAAILWNSIRANKVTDQTTNLIRAYRRELEWLTARIEALEGRVPSSQKAT